MQIHLVLLQTEHAKTSYIWRNDPKVWELTGSRPDKEITYEIEFEWIKKVLQREDEKRFAIIADGAYVGNIQLTKISSIDAELHIFIGDANFWDKGIATIATKLMLKKAFDEYNLKKVYLLVHKDNKSAQKVYKKNGFKVTEKIENLLKMEAININQH